MFHKTFALAASGVLAVSMTGCGSSSDKATSVKTSATTSATAPSSATTPVNSTSPTTQATSPVGTPIRAVTPAPKSSSHSVAAPKPAVTHAPPAVAAAAPGTVCYKAYRPNGHDDWGAYVGKNVSIGFCKNVGLAAMANRPNDGSPYDIQAASPTGKVITMHCTTSDTGATCSGGNDAVVEIGWNTGF